MPIDVHAEFVPRSAVRNDVITTETQFQGNVPFRVRVHVKEGYANIETVEVKPKGSWKVAGVQQAWFGSGNDGDTEDFDEETFGNVVLLVTSSGLCTVVSTHLEVFQLDRNERVKRFVSTVGSGGVPYGFIQTTKGTYMLGSFNCTTAFVPKNVPLDDEDAQCLPRGFKGAQPFRATVHSRFEP